MTVHIAMSAANCAAIMADSQTSSADSQYHGFQKLIVGKDFILGGAGSVQVMSRAFAQLREVDIPASDLPEWLERFMHEEVTPPQRDSIQFICLTPDVESGVRTFFPGVFTRVDTKRKFSSIGSGSEFVGRALDRDNTIGLPLSSDTLTDIVISLADLAEAANESLTVDDKLLLGLIWKDRAYLTGNRTISTANFPLELQQVWSAASSYFDDISAVAEAIRSHVRNAARGFNAIRTGTLDRATLLSIITYQDDVKSYRQTLREKIIAFMDWYDVQLGRTPLADTSGI